MRRAGIVDDVTGLGKQDHLCWAFDAPAEFRSEARRFLADGLSEGQRVVLIADWARPEDLDGLTTAPAAGALEVHDLGAYAGEALIDPQAQVEAYAEATARALADGFSGLRVAADVTPLVTTARSRAAFARYEFLVDGYMAAHPMSAMCGYSRRQLGADAVAEVAAMHPLASASATTLRLYAPGPRSTPVNAVLAGEIDMAGYELLGAALTAADLTPHGGVVTIDARELTFVDHRALHQLVNHISGLGARTRLLVDRRGPVPLLTRTLGLPDLRLVAS